MKVTTQGLKMMLITFFFGWGACEGVFGFVSLFPDYKCGQTTGSSPGSAHQTKAKGLNVSSWPGPAYAGLTRSTIQ